MTQKNKNGARKRIALLLTASLFLTLTIIAYSLGWFSFNKENSTGGIGMRAVDFPYEIRTNGMIIDHNNLSGDLDDYRKDVKKILKTLTKSDDIEIATAAQSNQTSPEKTSIQWLMVENEFFDNK